jgi:tetratricopeptide (TPR) repeat protein
MAYAQTDTAVLFAKAKALINEDKHTQAIPLLDQLLDVDNNNYSWHYERGKCYAITGRADLAVEDFTAAIKSNPSCGYCYAYRGVIYNAVHLNNEGLSDLNAALLLLPDKDSVRVATLTARGWLKYSIQDYKAAIADYLLALEIDSNYIGALMNICGAYLELGMQKEMDHYVHKVMKRDSTSSAWLSNLAFIYIKNKNYDAALIYADRAIAAEKNAKEKTGVPYNNRGYIKYMQGDMKGALKDINKALEIWDANSYAYRNRALVYIATKQMPKACEDMERALELGYTEQYGDDMQQLRDKHCSKK